MEQVAIEKGFETAFRCYLGFDANEAHEYFREHQEVINKAVVQISALGATRMLPPVLMVVSESLRDLGEKLSNLYELGYRPHGTMLINKEGYVHEYIQEVVRIELPLED